MTITIQDTFTGTAGTSLVSHTPDTGGAIELMAFSTSDATEVNPAVLRDVSGELTLGTSGTSRSGSYRYSADPGTDEYILRMTWSFHTQQSNRFTWMMWRMTPTGTADGDVDRYMLIGDANALQWELYKTVGGSANRVLLDVLADAGIAGGVFAVRVETLSTGQFVYVDDVLTVSSADVTITQRGRAGIGISRANNSTQWADNFSVDSVAGGGQVDLGTHSVLVAHVPLTVTAAGAATVTLTSHAIAASHQPLTIAGDTGTVTLDAHAVAVQHQPLAATGAGSVAVTLDPHAVQVTQHDLTVNGAGNVPVYISVEIGPMREPVAVGTMRDPLQAGTISGVEPVLIGELRDTTPTVDVLRDDTPTVGVLRDPLLIDEMRDPVTVDELRE